MYNKRKVESPLSSNYLYSLAISECNARLNRLRSTKSDLNFIQSQLHRLPDPRNFLWPLRRPVNPNPMMYAYQFVPPKIYEPLPKPIRTLPVSRETIQVGNRMKQYGADCLDLKRMLIKGADNILSNELEEDERKMKIYLDLYGADHSNDNKLFYLKNKVVSYF